MKARLLAASVCLSIEPDAGARRRAGADQPGVGPRRLQLPQEHREARGRAEGADRRARRADRRGDTARPRPASCGGCSRKGMTLLNGDPWTETLDYSRSLVLRTPRVVVDSSKPYAVRLEQIYAPSLALQNTVDRARHAPQASGAARARPAAAGAAARQGSRHVRRRAARSARVTVLLRPRSARCRRRPYLLNVEVSNQGAADRRASLQIALRKGVDELVARLEADAAKAPEALRAEILFPVDRMKNVNRGRLELRTFDPDRDLPSAEAVAAAVKAGKDPFAGRTGDIRRHYRLDAANEILPYRTYVPTTYTGAQGVSADHRAARPRRHRRRLLRQLREEAAAARRIARLHRRGAARLSRRRIVRLGPRHTRRPIRTRSGRRISASRT